jgi:hypothetical protein
MDMDVQRALVRLRARAARETSAELRAESRSLLGVSQELCRDGSSGVGAHRHSASRRLEWETASVDEGVVEWPLLRSYIEFDSAVVGRDVVIEEAKTMLCERFGISRGDAFQVLRRASSRRNRKLRDVARVLVQESLPA